MKLSRPFKISMAIAAAVIPGVACMAFLPSSIEGVYNPLSISSTMGCDCDQFLEFREGKVIYHVMESGDSLMNIYYEKDPSGSILVKLPSQIAGEKGELLARAEPHLVGTMFYYPDEGKSEWVWKRFVTRKMKAHMAGVKSEISFMKKKE